MMPASSSFIFINHNGPSMGDDALPRVRRHVMLQHRKQQREQKERARRLELETGALAIATVPRIQQETPPPEVEPEGHDFSDIPLHPSIGFDPCSSPKSARESVALVQPLNGHRIDPFNTLPIASNTHTDDLLRWHFYMPHIGVVGVAMDEILSNTQAIGRSFWDLALQNEMLLHTLLCTASAKRTATIRRTDPRYFYYKAKAIEAIRIRLSGGETGANDSLVLAIVEQAYLSMKDGDVGTAISHMRAGQRLTRAIGLSGFDYTQWRIAVWVDIFIATTLLTRPFLPYYPFGGSPPGQSVSFKQKMDELTTTTMCTFKLSEQRKSIGLHDIFHRLHTQSTVWMGRTALVVDAYCTAYRLCVMVAQISSKDDTLTFSTFDTIVLTAMAFTWTPLRHWLNSRIDLALRALLVRLFTAFRQDKDLVRTWRQGPGLEPLLWCLSVIGIYMMVFDLDIDLDSEREWFMKLLRRVVDELGISSSDNFVEKLAKFPSGKDDSGRQSRLLWDRIQDTPPSSGDLGSWRDDLVDSPLAEWRSL